MNGAVENGHVEVVQWLDEKTKAHRPAGVLLLGGHLEMLVTYEHKRLN